MGKRKKPEVRWSIKPPGYWVGNVFFSEEMSERMMDSLARRAEEDRKATNQFPTHEVGFLSDKEFQHQMSEMTRRLIDDLNLFFHGSDEYYCDIDLNLYDKPSDSE